MGVTAPAQNASHWTLKTFRFSAFPSTLLLLCLTLVAIEATTPKVFKEIR
jgi:hypothetical protein